MTFITYTLTNLVLFASLYLGMALSYIAKEEMNDGEKWFKLARNILFFMIIGLMIYYNYNGLVISISVVFLISYFLFLNNNYQDIIAYLFLGCVMFINNELTLIIPSLIFIYGLLQGTLLSKVKNIAKQIALRYVWFIAVSMGLYLI